jgi:tetratricopeptide (TPR) repeat protein
MPEPENNDHSRVFICYAREDRNTVYPEVDRLRKLAFDIHIDRHITPGVQWMEAVADAIASCQLVLFYASENSIRSDYCAQELRFALRHGINIVTVMLSKVDLPPWMELALGDSQILERFDMSRRSYDQLLVHGLSTHAAEGSIAPPLSSAPRFSHRSGRLIGIGIGIGVLGLLAVSLSFFQPGSSIPAIAVSTFSSADDQTSMLARGITGDLTEGFVKLDLLPVQVDIGNDESGVSSPRSATYVVSGEVELREGGFNIRTSLTDTDDQRRIWGQSWTYLSNDVAQVRDIHVRRVFAALPDVLFGTIPGLDTTTASERADAFAQAEKASALLANADSQQEFQSVRQLFERALEIYPGYGTPLLGLCKVLLLEFEIVHEIDLLVEAETRCLQALAVGTDLLGTHLSLGSVFIASGESELARTHYQRASNLAPKHADPWVGLASVAEMDGDEETTREYYERAVDAIQPSWQAHSAYAGFLISRGEIAEAAAQYQIVVDLNPESATAYNNLGTAWYYLGEFNKASDAWLRVAQLDPEPLAWANLGAAHTYQRDFAAALNDFRSAVQLAPKDHRWWGHIGELLVYMDEGESEEARHSLKEAIKLADEEIQFVGGSPVIEARLSTYYALIGEHSLARERLERAVASDTGNLQVAYSVAQTYKLLGEEAQVIRAIKRLLDAGYPKLLLDRDPWLN